MANTREKYQDFTQTVLILLGSKCKYLVKWGHWDIKIDPILCSGYVIVTLIISERVTASWSDFVRAKVHLAVCRTTPIVLNAGRLFTLSSLF